MALCSPTEVRALANSRKLTDADYLAIINIKSREVASRAGPTAGADQSGNDDLNTAGIYASAAQVLRNMQINGELAAQIKLGNDSVSNNIEANIQHHEEEAARIADKFRLAARYSGVSIPYSRVGPGKVNNTG